MDRITGVKKISTKLIILLKLFYFLGTIPELGSICEPSKREGPDSVNYQGLKKHRLECFLEISIEEINSSDTPCKAFDAIFL